MFLCIFQFHFEPKTIAKKRREKFAIKCLQKWKKKKGKNIQHTFTIGMTIKSYRGVIKIDVSLEEKGRESEYTG